jgi:Zn-dependent metalloprotease
MRNFLNATLVLTMCITTSVIAIRPDNQANSRIDGKSIRALKNSNVMLRSALVNDLRDTRIDGFSKQSPQLGFNFTQSVLDRANQKLKPFSSEMKLLKVDKDHIGISHVRMQQYHQGIPVAGSEIIAHVSKDNTLISVTGKWAPTLTINTKPALTPQSITNKINVYSGLSVKKQPSLVIFDNRLAYEYILEGKVNSRVKDKYIVDAQSGELLIKMSLIIDAAPGDDGEHVVIDGQSLTGEGGSNDTVTGWHNTEGNYFLYNKDSVWGVFNLNARINDWEQRSTASWGTSDPAAFSLARNLASVQNWVLGTLGRNSFDNNGAFMRANVHEGINYVNAYWDGEDMHFGDGDGKIANALTVLDIVAHEYGHAITQYTSNLVYAYESGALNESYSDIAGAIVEFLSQPDGKNSYPHGTPGKADWLCGEDCWLEGDALRDLKDPQRFGQPSYYKGTNWYTGDADNGGVHYNSGVQNFAFYLLTEGGSGTNDGHPYSINGLGLEQASNIAMYANLYLLTPSAQYRDARDAWILAATILGYNATTVSDVWTVAGLPPLEKHLDATPLVLDFGMVGIGAGDTLYADLTNSGGEGTIINIISTDNDVFTPVHGNLPLLVPAQSTIRLPILFAPGVIKADSAVITILSDALDNPLITLTARGTGSNPAIMTINPISIHNQLDSGDSTYNPIIIENTGEADLKITAKAIIDKTSFNGALPTISGTSKNVPRYATHLKAGTKLFQTSNPSFNSLASLSANAKVLYVNTILADTESDLFVNQLRAVEGIELDLLNAISSTPTVEALQTYDAVIVASNSSWSDPKLLGDNLASYVDLGGKVILLVASICDIPGLALEGKIMTPEYIPLEQGPADYNIGTAPTFENHPITDGITTLDCFIPVYTTQVTECGSSLGTYSSGTLVGAYNKNNSIVVINVFPAESYWQGDLVPMVTNAINWLGNAKWLNIKPANTRIIIRSTEKCTLNVAMNANSVFGGLYTGSISIVNNAPQSPNPFVVPCTLSVRGISRFDVSPLSHNFDTIWTNRNTTLSVALSNQGTLTTTVSSINISDPAFTIDGTLPIVIPPLRSINVNIRFTPSEARTYTGHITFINDAEMVENQSVELTGIGALPPIISVTPNSIAASLDPRSTVLRSIRIRNTGGANYYFNTQLNEATTIPLGTNPFYAIYGDTLSRINPVNGEIIGEQILLPIAKYLPTGISFDGNHIYITSYDSLIRVVDPVTGSMTRTIRLPQNILPLDIGVNDNVIAISNQIDYNIYILDKNTGNIITKWATPMYSNGCLAMKGNTNKLFLVKDYGAIGIFDILTGNEISTLTYYNYCSSMTYLAQTNELIVGSDYNNEISFIDGTTASLKYVFTSYQKLNAIGSNELGGSLPWISGIPSKGCVSAGSFIDIPVSINSGTLPAGAYASTIMIQNQLGGTPGPYTVHCDLSVNSTRLLSVHPANISFDTTWTNSRKSMKVDLYNKGSADIEIRNIMVKGTAFSFGATLPLIVRPYSHSKISVTFHPTRAGVSAGQLIIQSNATDNPGITVNLSGTAIRAPKLTSPVKSVTNTLNPGMLKSIPVRLTNSGDVDYAFFARGRSSFTPIAQSFNSRLSTDATIYISDRGFVYEIDPVTGRQVGLGTFIGQQSNYWNDHLAFDGKLLYFTSYGNPSIRVIDPALRIVSNYIAIPQGIEYISNIAVTKSHIAISCMQGRESSIIILDKVSGEAITSWALPAGIKYINGMCGTGSDNSLYIASDNKIYEVDKLTGVILRSISVKHIIWSIDYSTSANLLLSKTDNKVLYLDPSDGRTVDSTTLSSDSSMPYLGDLASDEAGTVKSWITTSTRTGNVAARGSATIDLALDTRNMQAGVYLGYFDISYIGVNTADPLSIPCTLTVTSAGRCTIKPIIVDFGSTVVKTSTEVSVDIANDGNMPITISTTAVSNSTFTVSNEPFVVPPFSTVKLPVIFAPKRVGAFRGTLRLTTNAVETQPNATLIGTGVPKSLTANK